MTVKPVKGIFLLAFIVSVVLTANYLINPMLKEAHSIIERQGWIPLQNVSGGLIQVSDQIESQRNHSSTEDRQHSITDDELFERYPILKDIYNMYLEVRVYTDEAMEFLFRTFGFDHN